MFERFKANCEERQRQAEIAIFREWRPIIQARRDQERQDREFEQRYEVVQKQRLVEYYAKVAETLKDQVNHLALVSNFSGDLRRAQDIAISMSETWPKDTPIGFSVHLSRHRIELVDNTQERLELITRFEANATALQTALIEQGFTNVIDFNAEEALIMDGLLDAQQLAGAVAETQTIVGEQGSYLHLAVVSALESKEVGLPYDAQGGTHLLAGFDPENNSPQWKAINTKELATPLHLFGDLLNDLVERIETEDNGEQA